MKTRILFLAIALFGALFVGCEDEPPVPDTPQDTVVPSQLSNNVFPNDEGWPFVMQLQDSGKYCAFQSAWEEGLGSGLYAVTSDSISIIEGESLDIYTYDWLFDTVLPCIHGTHAYGVVQDSLRVYADRISLVFVDSRSYNGNNIDSLYGSRCYFCGSSESNNNVTGLQGKTYVLVYYSQR